MRESVAGEVFQSNIPEALRVEKGVFRVADWRVSRFFSRLVLRESERSSGVWMCHALVWIWASS